MLKDVRLCVEEAKALGVPDEVMTAVLDSGKRPTPSIGGDSGFHRHRADDRDAAPASPSVGRNHERRHPRGLCRLLRPPRAASASENYIFGDPHDEMTLDLPTTSG